MGIVKRIVYDWNDHDVYFNAADFVPYDQCTDYESFVERVGKMRRDDSVVHLPMYFEQIKVSILEELLPLLEEGW